MEEPAVTIWYKLWRNWTIYGFLAHFSKLVIKKKKIEKDQKTIEMNQNINQLISNYLEAILGQRNIVAKITWNFQWWSRSQMVDTDRPTLILRTRKLVDRIYSNFMRIQIYIQDTFCKILDRIGWIVFVLQFMKGLNFGEEEPRLCTEKLEINPNLNTKFSAVSIQKELKLMWFINDILLDISVKQLRNLYAERGEISRILFEVWDIELFESHTMPNYLFWNKKDERCHDQWNYSILMTSSRRWDYGTDWVQLGRLINRSGADEPMSISCARHTYKLW